MGTGLKFLPERKLLLHPAGGGGLGNTYETVSGFGFRPPDRAVTGILVSSGPTRSPCGRGGLFCTLVAVELSPSGCYLLVFHILPAA